MVKIRMIVKFGYTVIYCLTFHWPNLNMVRWLDSLRYFEHYFQTAEAISEWNELRACRRYKIKIAMLVTQGFSIILQYLLDLPVLLRLMLVDMNVITKMSRKFKLGIGLLHWMMAYYYLVFYFYNWNPATKLIYRIAILGRPDFYLWPNNQNGVPLTTVVRKYFIRFCASFRPLFILINLYFLRFEVKLCIYFLQNNYFSSLSGYVYYWAHICHAMVYFYIENLGLEIWMIATTLEVVFTVIVFGKFAQFFRWLAMVGRGRLRPTHCHRIRRFCVEMLSLIRWANQTYGRSMFVFILVNCPINAYFTMLVVTHRHLSGVNKALILCITLEQMIVIFAVHLVSAQYCAKLHRPAKRLISELPTVRFASLRHRTQIGHFVQAFHTRQRYGITYGNTGLVTLASFAKVGFECMN